MPAPYAHIVCCFEDSDASRRALAEARRLRALGPGRLTVLHVANQPVWWGMGVGDAVPVPQAFEDPEQLRRWLADEAGDDGVEVEILSGYPPAAACSWAEDHDADLIVAAAHRGFVDRVLLGSFAGFLAHHSPCPVLLVRPPHVATADEPSGAGAGPAT